MAKNKILTITTLEETGWFTKQVLKTGNNEPLGIRHII